MQGVFEIFLAKRQFLIIAPPGNLPNKNDYTTAFGKL